MPILQIIDTIDLGGAQTVVKGIVDKQLQDNDLHLFALRTKDITIDIEHPNFFVHEGTTKYSFAALQELRELIEEKKISCIHCHLLKSQVFGYLLKTRYFPDIKLIFHEHGQIFGTNTVEDFVFFNFLKKAKKHVDLFIAVSKATKQKLVEKTKVDPDKIDVLYNFVDLNKYDFSKSEKLRKVKRAEYNIPDQQIVIGFAGRLDTIKGLRYLINALPELNFDYKVLLAGDGPIRQELEAMVLEKQLQEKVIFMGFQSDMPSIYPAFDIYAMPSLSEASPMTFYEAQAFGKPVVGSNVSAIDEFVIPYKNGLLFELKNAVDMAKKLNELGNNRSMIQTMSENGIKGVNKYSLNAFIDNLNEIYSQRNIS